MPLYSVLDSNTGEISEVSMKYTEFLDYIGSNQNLKQVFTKFPGIGDSIRLGIRKPDDGFRDVLKNVKHHHKKDTINTF